MKTARCLIVAIGLVLLLSSCFFSNPWQAGGEGDSAYLPPDTINDTARSYSGPFQFETLLPVSLNLQIEFYELDADGPGAKLQQTAPESSKAVVVITDNDGNVVYEGAVQADGTLDAEMALPAAPEDMVLTVKAQGYEERSVMIHDLVNYSSIERTMGLMSDGGAAKGELLVDSDSDGVPDAYDAFPNNPDLAFTVRVPDEQWLTVAFEDLYLQEGAGDGDYNDFLAFYSFTEFYDSDNRLVKIEGDAKAETKIAGYDHEFGIAIGYEKEDSDDFQVSIEANYIDMRGNSRSASLYPQENFSEPFNSTYKKKAVIPLFLSTEQAVGKTASFVVSFSSPVDRDKVEPAPYDPYLLVHDTGYDIHLIGKDPLPDTNNPEWSYSNPAGDSTNFLDEVGFPWALLVPADWQHPAEGQFIEELYPYFKDWRETEGASCSNWYLRPLDPNNMPPNPVSMSPTSMEFTAGLEELQTQEMRVKMGDPDGDAVTLLWSETPEYLDIAWSEENNHLDVTVENAPAGELTVYFWSRDARGASSEYKPAAVIFSFVESAEISLVIETFVNPYNSSDTYLTLFNSEGVTIAEDDNGNPDQVNNRGCSRIEIVGNLPAGTYYIKVENRTGDGNPNYGIEVLDFDPGSSVPTTDTTTDEEDGGSDDGVDGTGVDDGIPTNPVPIDIGDVVARAIYPAGDVDWFELVLP